MNFEIFEIFVTAVSLKRNVLQKNGRPIPDRKLNALQF
jgi:hypothetical protein